MNPLGGHLVFNCLDPKSLFLKMVN